MSNAHTVESLPSELNQYFPKPWTPREAAQGGQIEIYAADMQLVCRVPAHLRHARLVARWLCDAVNVYPLPLASALRVRVEAASIPG
jgi:hypothetical protein